MVLFARKRDAVREQREKDLNKCPLNEMNERMSAKFILQTLKSSG